MILNKTILILEDELTVISKIVEKLAVLEGNQPYSLSIIVLTNYIQVEELINTKPNIDIDIVLLDRDCKIGGSFHILEIERLDPKKFISISSVPEYNEQARKRGVKKIILKNYSGLDQFADDVAKEVELMLREMPILKSKVYR